MIRPGGDYISRIEKRRAEAVARLNPAEAGKPVSGPLDVMIPGRVHGEGSPLESLQDLVAPQRLSTLEQQTLGAASRATELEALMLEVDAAKALTRARASAFNKVSVELEGSTKREPALAALAETFEALHGVAGQLGEGHGLPASATPALAQTLISLARSEAGRAGGERALTTLPAWLKILCRSGLPKDAAAAAERFQAIADIFSQHGPRAELMDSDVAAWTQRLTEAYAESKGDPRQALAQLRVKLRADARQGNDAARAELRALPLEGRPEAEALVRALFVVLDENPEGPDSLYKTVIQLAGAVSEAGEKVSPAWLAEATKAVEHCGPSRLAQRVCQYLTAGTVALKEDKEHPAQRAFSLLQEAPRPEDPLENLALAIAAASFPETEHDAKAVVEEALSPLLGGQSPEAALRVALAFAKHVLPTPGAPVTGERKLLDVLVSETTARGGDICNTELFSLAGKYGRVFPALHEQMHSVDLAGSQALVIAKRLEAIPNKRTVENIARTLQTVQQLFPGDEGSEAFAPADGTAGIYSLIDKRLQYRNENPFERFFQPLAFAVAANKEKARQLIPAMVEVAMAMGQLEGQPDQVQEQVSVDWQRAQALKRRALLELFTPGNVLPPELRPTAALHLKPAQLDWLEERIRGAKWRDSARYLRNFTMACASTGRMDLFDAVRSDKVTSRTRNAVISYVGEAFRKGELREVDFDAWTAQVHEGKNPVVEARAQAEREAIEALELGDGVVVPANGEGPAADLVKAARAIKGVEAFIANPQRVSAQDVAMLPPADAFRGPWEAAMQDIRAGTWPKVKYENEVGKRQMATWKTDEQRKLWRQAMLTPLKGEAKAEAGGHDFEAAKPLLRGLSAAVEQLFPLEKALKASWDRVSLERLQKERDGVIAQLRQLDKNQVEARRELGARASKYQRALRPLELKVALDEAVMKQELGAEGEKLRALLAEAARYFDGRNLEGPARAAREARELIHTVKVLKREGVYAIDEDGLEPLINSNHSGCVNAEAGFRRWGLVGALCDANIRMIRTLDGDRQRVRAFLKFFEVKLPGYEGPALWVDYPIADGGGGQQERVLLYRHALRKAAALGVPVLFYEDASFHQAAATEGYQVSRPDVTFKVDVGNTGTMHSDYLFGGLGALHRMANGKTQFSHRMYYGNPTVAQRADGAQR